MTNHYQGKCLKCAPVKSEGEETEDVKCPFCGLEGFDKIGLKYHLKESPCQQFIETPLLTKF